MAKRTDYLDADEDVWVIADCQRDESAIAGEGIVSVAEMEGESSFPARYELT
ncbi:MAG: hypothetical protein ACKVHP_20780 [Verrucomicrobiales bacterium]